METYFMATDWKFHCSGKFVEQFCAQVWWMTHIAKIVEIAVVLMAMLCVVSIHLSGLILIVIYELQFELRVLFIFV